MVAVIRWTPILSVFGLMRTAKSAALFGFVRVLIVLPSSLKTTLATLTPRTRAKNARETQPVGARSRALPGMMRSPATICSYWETDALGAPPEEVPDVLAMTAEPP